MDHPILSCKLSTLPTEGVSILTILHYIDFLFYLNCSSFLSPSAFLHNLPLGLQALSEQRSLQSRDCVKRGIRQERGKPGILRVSKTFRFDWHMSWFLLWYFFNQGYSIELLKVTSWSTTHINLIEPKYAPFPKYALIIKRQDTGSRNRLFWKTFRKRGHMKDRYIIYIIYFDVYIWYVLYIIFFTYIL